MGDLILAGAQVPSVSGDVARNVATHLAAVEAAAMQGASLVAFPELSLTGYEPAMAATLVLDPHDRRLRPLREAAMALAITIVAGAPLASGTPRPHVGALILRLDGTTGAYRKMHLGSSERPHFTPGDAPCLLDLPGGRAGLAICADTSEASHADRYASLGADAYVAGVMLTADWYATDAARLPAHAARASVLALMVNHGASRGTLTSVGRSAAWAPGGALLAQVEDDAPVLVVARKRRAGADVRWSAGIVPLAGVLA